ncbi:hypothetical protein K431DRAFT_303606 [Polychaeton citri CBS 116435]|uniref:Uncharacterized protein n=1 Tax=Polychaeton citri CBS 116435 TaxID=1314669 RepID=A0A9P4Q885_9PEZI|nr:hypothetical protein K431DRAFT_303606 [Polychaeton citri CBS 116435]
MYQQNAQMQAYEPKTRILSKHRSGGRFISHQAPGSKYKNFSKCARQETHHRQDDFPLFLSAVTFKPEGGIEEPVEYTLHRSRQGACSYQHNSQNGTPLLKKAKLSRQPSQIPRPTLPRKEVGERPRASGEAWEAVKQFAVEFEAQRGARMTLTKISSRPLSSEDMNGRQPKEGKTGRVWRSAIQRGSFSARGVFGIRDALNARAVKEIVPFDRRRGLSWEKDTDIQDRAGKTDSRREDMKKDSGVDFDICDAAAEVTDASSVETDFAVLIARATRDDSEADCPPLLHPAPLAPALPPVPPAPPASTETYARKSEKPSGRFPAQKRKPLSVINPVYPQAPIRAAPSRTTSHLAPPQYLPTQCRPPPPASVCQYSNKPLPSLPLTPPSSQRKQERATSLPLAPSRYLPETASGQNPTVDAFIGKHGKVGVVVKWRYGGEGTVEEMRSEYCAGQHAHYDGSRIEVECLPAPLGCIGGYF